MAASSATATRARLGRSRMADRPERTGRDRFCHRGEDRLLEPHADAAGDAAGRQQARSARAASRKSSRWRCSATWSATRRKSAIPSRVAEVLNRVIQKAKRAVCAGADQHSARLLDPRHRHRVAGNRRIRAPGRRRARRSPKRRGCCRRRNSRSSCRAPASCSATRSPIAPRSPNGSTRRSCNNYQHNDCFPGGHRLAAGPLGYNGSKAAMELVARADIVLALGTRLNPFSTLPGYGLDYWPKAAEGDPGRHQRRPHRPDQAGRVGICGDAKLVARAILARLDADRRRRGARAAQGARPHDSSRVGCRRSRA